MKYQVLNIIAIPCAIALMSSVFISCNEDEEQQDIIETLSSAKANGVVAVDLGLPSGIRWANMNIGAENPEDIGLYFAWGDTKGYGRNLKDERAFDYYDYKFSKGGRYSNGYTAYTNANDGILKENDDAAYINWGQDWRMPTSADITELIKNTISSWTTQNGVYGKLFKSKKNGNTIFLPASGYRGDHHLTYRGINGYYWSSTRDYSTYSKEYKNAVCLLCFESADNEYRTEFQKNKDLSLETDIYRYYGLAIRPVTDITVLPKLSADDDPITLTKGYALRVSFKYANTVTEAKIRFGNITKIATVASGKITASFPLEELSVTDSYDGFYLTAKNENGESYASIAYKLLVSSGTNNYSDDGEKSDCIRLCGIDWAKGNLVYDHGTWRIKENAAANTQASNTSNYGEYFSPYFTTCDNQFRNRTGIVYTEREEYQGYVNGIYGDVTAAHLSGWVTPSADQMSLLRTQVGANYLSRISGKNGLLFFPVMANRQFIGNLPINIEMRPTNALYLPYGYVSSSSVLGFDSTLSAVYLTSTYHYDNYNHDCCITTKIEKISNSDSFSTAETYMNWRYKLPVRPIKAK